MARSLPTTSIFAACLAVACTAPLGAQASPAGIVGRINLDSLHWSGRPGGVQLATIEGDPMVTDKPYTVALRLGSGAWIQPHWHPRLQHVAVLSARCCLATATTSTRAP